jgi:metal-responsive CopG/Arc/MetJ family transcriptional regulator
MHDMKDQITVRLPRELSRALDAAAKRSQRRRSEVIRLSLVAYLTPRASTPGRPVDRVRGLIGSLESGIPDLAENHRKYILESLKNAR